MKMKSVAGVIAVLAMTFGFAGVGGAAPAQNSVVGGPGAHPHHVHLGNGECRDINSVLFEVASRGLHQGSNASGGHERGPFHGPCH